MLIFFVTNNYTPYSGGVTQSITAMTNALRTQGHEVFVITLNFLEENHTDPDYVIRITCPIKFVYKNNHMAIPWRPTNTIEELIKQHKPDIVHVHHPFLLGVSALRAARKCNIPCIFTYHTLYEQYAHYVPLPRMCLQPIIRSAVGKFCNKVDAIIAPSNCVKNYLLSQKIMTPMTVIPSPLRESFNPILHGVHPDTSTSSAFAKASADTSTVNTSPEFNLLLVTRFALEKNIPFVFEVMQLLPDNFRLTLAGYGTDYEKMQVLAFDTFKHCPTRICFIHKPTEKKLVELYRAADVFIFPSQTDTQGIVLAESMSQGVPVVAVDGPGQRDIIVNEVNGFIVKDAADAAEKISIIAHNPAVLQQLIAGAQTTAQKYHADCVVQQLLTAYRNTMQAYKQSPIS